MILVNSYENKVRELDNPQIVHVALEGIPEFFNQLRQERVNGISKEYVLISSASDYTLCYQKENNPNKDLVKHAHAIDWQKLGNEERYQKVEVGPTMNPKLCSPYHKFSIKIHAYTMYTFDKIPSNVKHWYCTNANVREDNVSALPFGINFQGHGHKIIDNYKTPFDEKDRALYLNFTDHTMQRRQLKAWYDSVDYAKIQRDNVPYEQFCTEMTQCQFVMSPPGNGLDCYRTYEAIQLNCIPILEYSNMAINLSKLNLPIMIVKDLFQVTPDVLERAIEQISDFTFSQESLDIEWWADKWVKHFE